MEILKTLSPYRPAMIAWLALVLYLTTVQAGAGIWYYQQLPKANTVVVAVPPSTPPKTELAPIAGQQTTESPNTNGTSQSVGGSSRPGGSPIGLTQQPGERDSNKRPATAVEPPIAGRIGPKIVSKVAPPVPTEPKPTTALVPPEEPAPVSLRKRLMILVLATSDLRNADDEEERKFPLRDALKRCRDEYRDDLAGDAVFILGTKEPAAVWSLDALPREIEPFEANAYHDAIAAAGGTIQELLPANRLEQYDYLLVWYCHDNPDQKPRTVSLSAELKDRGLLLWAGDSAHEGSDVLDHLFPDDRCWPLRANQSPGILSGLVRSQLKSAQPVESRQP